MEAACGIILYIFVSNYFVIVVINIVKSSMAYCLVHSYQHDDSVKLNFKSDSFHVDKISKCFEGTKYNYCWYYY